jgi:hypothetical protein
VAPAQTLSHSDEEEPSLRAQLFLGRNKLGTLDFSVDGLSWKPKGRSPTYFLSWDQVKESLPMLIAHPDEVEAVLTTPERLQALRDVLELPGLVKIDSTDQLLSFFGSEDVGTLGEYLFEAAELEEPLDLDADDSGVSMYSDGHSTGLLYPFNIRRLWTILGELDDLYYLQFKYEELADNIREVEHFEVVIEPDPEPYYCDNSVEMGGEFVIVFDKEYPYRRAMGGSKTIQEWITERFEKHYPGLLVEMDTKLPTSATLLAVRQEQ